MVRLNRFVGAYTDRIVNPKTARTQVIDGIICRTGETLLERPDMDPVMGVSSTTTIPWRLICPEMSTTDWNE
jgi:hypothetical protein